MKYPIALTLTLVLSGMLYGQGGSGMAQETAVKPTIAQSTNTKAHDADTIQIQGTIVHKSFEGGFFAIDSDDGKKYDPVNLSISFKKDGLKVKVKARLKKNAVGFHMYGTIIEIIEIEKR